MPFKPLTGSSDEQKWGAATDMLRELFDLKVVQVFKDEAGTRRVILDKDGLRTSPPGVDVFTAGNDDLTFNSNQNVFKIVQTGTSTTGTASVTDGGVGVWNNDSDQVTIAHNLGYVPAVVAFISDGGLYIDTPYTSYGNPSSSAISIATVSTSTDATNLYINVSVLGLHSTASLGPLPIKYYLLQETAA